MSMFARPGDAGQKLVVADGLVNVARRERSLWKSWRDQAQAIEGQAKVFYFVFKHPRTRWCARLVAACTAAYMLSPIQLIPSFIPVIGFLDDLLVLLLGVKLLHRIVPQDVLMECRVLADNLELGRKERIRFVAIVSLWFVAASCASAQMVRHFLR